MKDQDDGDRPASKGRREPEDHEEERDDRPWRRGKRERDDDDEDDRPRRRRRDDDSYDDDDGREAIPRGLMPSTNTSALAIISGYLGLISVLILPAPFALFTGVLALRQLRRNRKLDGYSRAIIGIVMGALFSLPIPFIVIALIAGK